MGGGYVVVDALVALALGFAYFQCRMEAVGVLCPRARSFRLAPISHIPCNEMKAQPKRVAGPSLAGNTLTAGGICLPRAGLSMPDLQLLNPHSTLRPAGILADISRRDLS
jgi:hypothetical protein